MKLKIKFTFGLCLLILTFIIGGCSVSQEQKNIYSDDFKITQEGDSFTYINRIDTADFNDKINIKYSGFSGIDTVWNIETDENSEITFKYNSIVSSGDFKAVLINPKKEIETIIVGNQQGDKTIKLTKGKYAFKIVGRTAKGEIEIFINKTEKVKINKNSTTGFSKEFSKENC